MALLNPCPRQIQDMVSLMNHQVAVRRLLQYFIDIMISQFSQFYLMTLTMVMMLANGLHLVWYCSMAIQDYDHFRLVAKWSLECVSKQKSKVQY